MSTNKTTLTIKIDKDLKEQASHTAKQLGLPLGSIMNVFLRQLIVDKRFTISATPVMTPYLEGLIAEAKAEYEAGQTAGPFTSADDMLKSLKK